MKALESVENSLEDIFVKQAPSLPPNAKKVIVEWLPWINLIIAVLSLWAAWTLWHWAHYVNKWVDVANQLSNTYGVSTPTVDRLSFGVWLALGVMTIQAVIYIIAFPALRARQKRGWDLLFLGLLVNLIYGVVVMFTTYGGIGSLIGSLIGTAIGLYFLFQIKELYLSKSGSGNKKSSAKK